MINVLVVDDSPVLRRLLWRILESDPELHVAGSVDSGEAALEFLAGREVDVVTMDIHMTGMDGFETTRTIMESDRPLPVVMVSSCWDPVEVEKTFEAMGAGAVAILGKPPGTVAGSDDYSRELLRVVKEAAASRVNRLRRRGGNATRSGERADYVNPAGGRTPPAADGGRISIVAVGASTGGPQALAEFLAPLPEHFPRPILVVQHIAKGFTPGLVDWLGRAARLRVVMAREGERPEGGLVYVAPEGLHMGLGTGGLLTLSDDPPEHLVRPSASWLFRSVAAVHGGRAAAILFSGMGSDGAVELGQLRALGAVTFAQDRASSVVWGMPGEAVRLGAAAHVGDPSRIASILLDAVMPSGRSERHD